MKRKRKGRSASRRKEGERRKEASRGKKDRGPFNVASTADYDEEESERSRPADSLDESSESQDFRKAPHSTSYHLKLVRYAKRHPGRLAARMLHRMEAATGFGGGPK